MAQLLDRRLDVPEANEIRLLHLFKTGERTGNGLLAALLCWVVGPLRGRIDARITRLRVIVGKLLKILRLDLLCQIIPQHLRLLPTIAEDSLILCCCGAIRRGQCCTVDVQLPILIALAGQVERRLERHQLEHLVRSLIRPVLTGLRHLLRAPFHHAETLLLGLVQLFIGAEVDAARVEHAH